MRSSAAFEVAGAEEVGRRGASALVELYTSWEAAEPGAGHGEQAAHWREVAGVRR